MNSRHSASSLIVKQAVESYGQGIKGLAAHLGKDPSLVSRYAGGEVRPKAETLLRCLEIVEHKKQMLEIVNSTTPSKDLERLKGLVSVLSEHKDQLLIKSLLSLFILAGKH